MKELIREYGFTRESLTAYLIDAGLMKKGEKIISWRINERDFFEFETRERQ